jgi:hypothetical protein
MSNVIPQYYQVANAQTLAAQQTISDQQKQAAMFRGGRGSGDGFIPPDMGGNNNNTQKLANDLTRQIGNHISLSANDYRVGGKRTRRLRRKKRTNRKKHNKRITKRRYIKRW